MKQFGAAALAMLVLLLCHGCSSPPWRPQVVVLVDIDPLRADHLGCYGYSRPTTPYLDRLAREGVLFENAFSNANLTTLSYSALLTGRYPPDLPGNTYRLPPGLPTLATVLHSYGFWTGASTGGGMASREFGFGRGFDFYDDRVNVASFFTTLPPALRFLRQAAAARASAFLVVRSYDAHIPTHHPLGFDNLYMRGYSGVADEITSHPGSEYLVRDNTWYGERVHRPWQVDGAIAAGLTGLPLTARDYGRIDAVYDGAVTYADLQVGRLMHEIFRLGLGDKTLVIVDGDHGEHLGERGTLGHDTDLDDTDLHVPLILWGRGVSAGRRCGRVVELVDVAPTILDFLGLPVSASRAGVSLAPLARGGALPGADTACAVALGSGATIRDRRYRLVLRNPWGLARLPQNPVPTFVRDGLYDVARDPAEATNLISRPEMRDIVAAMKARLLDRLRDGGQPGAVPQ